jgi:hypothetical protein
MVNNPVKGQQYMARIENARMKDPTGSNPVAEEGVIKLQEAVKTAKTNMNSKFDQSMKAIKHVTDDLDVETVAPDELMNLFNNVDGQMREMGLIDEAGEALSVSEARLQALGDPTTINRMHVVYTKLRNLIKGPAPKTFKMNVSNPGAGSTPDLYDIPLTKAERVAQEQKFLRDQAYGWDEKAGFSVDKPPTIQGAQDLRHQSKLAQQFGPEGGKPGSTTVEVTPAETLDLKTMKTKSNRQRVTFNDLMTLQRGIDDIATKAKAYKGQPFEITPEGAARIAGVRSGVHKVALTALERRDVRAAKWFDKTNKEFSESRKWFDDSAAELRDGRIDQTLDKMLDDPSRGIIKRDLMEKVFDDNGVDGKALLEDLFLRRGATNTVDFLGGSGAGSVQASALKRGINKLVLKGAARGGDVQRRALKSTTDDLVKGANPENFGGKAKELKRGKIQGQMRGVNEGSSLPVGKENFKSKIPLTKESLAEARSRGMLVQWIQQQTPETVKNLINSPRAMNALSQIMYQAQTEELSITDALVQQAMETSMPAPTPMIPQEEE